MSSWEEGLRNAAETLSNPALRWIGAAVLVLAVLAWLSLRQTRPKPPAPPPVRLHPDPVVDAALREKARRERAEQDRLDTNVRRVANRDAAICVGILGLFPACRHLASIRDGIVVGTYDDNPADESGSCSRGIGERALPADHLIATRATSDRGPRPGRSTPCTATRRPGTAYFGLHNGTTAVGGASDS